MEDIQKDVTPNNDMKDSDVEQQSDENIENIQKQKIEEKEGKERENTEDKNKVDLKEEDKIDLVQMNNNTDIIQRNEQDTVPTEVTIEPLKNNIETKPVEALKEESKEEPDRATGIIQTLPSTENDSDVQRLRSKDEDTELKEEKTFIQNGSIPVLDEGSDVSDGVEIIQEQDHLESTEQEAKVEFHPGVLEITVHRASNLVNNDKFSKSDPYVKLRYNKVEFRSETISNNLNPEWNFSASFDILNEEEMYIHINVYDDDFGRDNIQGCYSLPLELALNQLTEVGQWFSLVGCESGRIFLSSQFTRVKMEDKSIEKPIEISDESGIDTKTLEKAEKLVSDIVEKAEKVVNEVEAKLEKDGTVGTEATEETFKEISKGSQEVIEKIVEKIDKNEEIKVDESNKTISSPRSENRTDTDSFKEIEKESKDVVEKIESSMKQTTETSVGGTSEALIQSKPEDKISSDEKDEGDNNKASVANDTTQIKPTENTSSEDVSQVKTGVAGKDEETISQVQKTEIDSVAEIVPVERKPTEDPSTDVKQVRHAKCI